MCNYVIFTAKTCNFKFTTFACYNNYIWENIRVEPKSDATILKLFDNIHAIPKSQDVHAEALVLKKAWYGLKLLRAPLLFFNHVISKSQDVYAEALVFEKAKDISELLPSPYNCLTTM